MFGKYTTRRCLQKLNFHSGQDVASKAMSGKISFDTYKLVRDLETTRFTRAQSVAVMQTISALLSHSTLALHRSLIPQTDLETSQYHQKAKLEESRMELSSLRQNDTSTLKQEVEVLTREVETLTQLLQDLSVQLKSDISMDINEHKTRTKDLSSTVDLRIQDIQHGMAIKLSDLKTSVETMKVELTTSIVWMTGLLVVALLVVDSAADGIKAASQRRKALKGLQVLVDDETSTPKSI